MICGAYLLSITLLIFRIINAADYHVIMVKYYNIPEIYRRINTRDSRCFILTVIFGLHTGFIEGMDGWSQ